MLWQILKTDFYCNVCEKKLTSREKKFGNIGKIFADVNFWGYSKLKGEIDSQRSLHIGASDRAIPDIIRDMTSQKDLFVILPQAKKRV